ncbi:Intracellular septation protein [Pseudovibrio sp. W64]|uniref:septation protein A n=1 Tax=unclassified Pseudovibrio TaxID=2627060 RepID=UPI0007AEAC68|nr:MULTISPECIES: septation protein A [unclassified Pseudovibrio]KZK87321.1 Intracellular septation protein [Pseudovibrio sp. Ad13]KZK89297.1 Intracellular septation protein [Pseudovibrio sp. W64]KZL28765.1 Intracellular septation protein [Pseudovibrio sp. Ad37]
MNSERSTQTTERQDVSPLLKLALELGPLGVFFIANSRGAQLAEMFPALGALGQPIFIATAAFMVAITISLTVSYILTRHLPVMPVVSGVVVLVFGALTLYLQDDLFIKLKPTIVNTLFGSILLGGLFFGKSLLGYVFDSAFKLDAEGWRKLTMRWGLFFFVLALINEFVWRNFSTDFWVDFKVFGFMPITMVFTMMQLPLIQKHSLESEEKS